MEIKLCKKCNEDGILIAFNDPTYQFINYFVRVRRSSKCKHYYRSKHKPNVGTCRTELFRTANEAIEAWDKKQGA